MQTLTSPAVSGVRTLNNYVDGAWVQSDGDTIPVYNPATGEVISRVPLSTPAEVNTAARAAEKAFEGWRHTPPQERARFMFALRRIM